MYIDPISGTLQSLNDTAGTLNRIKSQYERDRLARAELLNRMGQDETAEKALWDADHSGMLSSLLPNTATGRGAEGAFLEDAPEQIPLQGLNTLSGQALAGQNVLPAFSNAKGGVDQLAGLNGELYNGISSDILNDGGKVVAQGKKFKPVKGDKAFAGELGAYEKETAANKQIEEDNRKAQAYNESIPQFRQSYEGNEPDQLNQLADDTMAAIKFAERNGDTQGAAAAYNKYVQTGRAIAQGFQHNFTPLGSEYFFTAKKGKGGGGTGGKYDNYMIKRSDGSKVSLQLPKGVDPDSKQGRQIAAEKGIVTKDLNYNPGDWHPESTDSSYLTEKEQQEANKIAADLDRDAKNEAQMAWDGTYKGIDIHKSPKDRADEANNILGPNSKYMYVVNQWGGVNMVERNGYSDKRNVVQSNPEDEVVF
jgi:hypothetical protein